MPLPPKNLLSQETSPYLLQHKDNPVHWRAWGPEALAESRETNKPILLSVGYAACHWCHVMAQESFEDRATAAVMNRLFVNIKVDREERPDIDGIYQAALQLLGEQGGWPLTMFLTPDAEPFWGGTYFPPEAKYGRPAFVDLLLKASEVFKTQPHDIALNAAKIKTALDAMGQPKKGALIPVSILDQVAERILREFDMEHGGLGSAPKFPHSSHFELIWRAYLRGGKTALRDAVVLSLEKMSQGGIYDHLGGGFARYSTDQKWLVPHFEKMLYDNAQLIEILTLVWQETRQPLFAQRVEETVQWLTREMVTPDGGFGATLDADSEHEEGKFYVWSEAEIDAALIDVPVADLALFKRVYDVSAAGNWEGKIILNRTAHAELLSDEEEAALARLRAKLLAVRAGRVRPGWDDKMLADWNGMMIATLAFAAGVFGRADWRDMALRAYATVKAKLGDGDRLFHSYRDGQRRGAGMIDDYAQMARAALALFEATGATEPLADAERWIGTLDAHFWDAKDGGYYFTADDAEGLIVRRRDATDQATPAGNAVAAGALARLWYLTGKEEYRARAEETVAAFAGEIARNFFPLPSLLNANQFLQHGVQIVLTGDGAAAHALRAAAESVSLPDRVVQHVAPGQALPASHPAHGKQAPDGAAAAYVCVGQTCTLPISDPVQLVEALKAARVIRSGAPNG
ncbi:MAG: thioredoxin domain-containing protein [Alphaproteobacteria bacterium]